MQTVANKSGVQTPRAKPPSGKEPGIASESVPNTLAALKVNPEKGLTHGEVDTLRKQHGYNEVAEQKEHPVLKFLGKFWGLSAWMLELIMLLSLVLGHYSDLVIVGALSVINAVQTCLTVADSSSFGSYHTDDFRRVQMTIASRTFGAYGLHEETIRNSSAERGWSATVFWIGSIECKDNSLGRIERTIRCCKPR